MAQLKCEVNNCAYNDSCLCCKGDIMVGGKHACCDDETCCESFVDEKRDSFTSALDHPSKTISIDCECRETACATFEEK